MGIITGEETKAHKAPEFAHPRCSEFRVQAPHPQAAQPGFVFVSTPTGRNRSILGRQVPEWVEVESGWGLELRAQGPDALVTRKSRMVAGVW